MVEEPATGCVTVNHTPTRASTPILANVAMILASFILSIFSMTFRQ